MLDNITILSLRIYFCIISLRPFSYTHIIQFRSLISSLCQHKILGWSWSNNYCSLERLHNRNFHYQLCLFSKFAMPSSYFYLEYNHSQIHSAARLISDLQHIVHYFLNTSAKGKLVMKSHLFHVTLKLLKNKYCNYIGKMLFFAVYKNRKVEFICAIKQNLR